LCEPVSQGGLGFDYYVNLSASEMWVSLLDNVPDNEWSMSKVIAFTFPLLYMAEQDFCPVV